MGLTVKNYFSVEVARIDEVILVRKRINNQLLGSNIRGFSIRLLFSVHFHYALTED